MPRIDNIQLRRDSAADWASADPTLNEGEPGYETDTGILKIGDGSTAWSSLANVFRPDPYVVVGIKIDNSNSNPALTYVDINKNVISLDATFFDTHPVWGGIRRCVIDSSGNIEYGSNARGDGLDLTGASGDVMVEFPKFYWKVEDAYPLLYIWVSPYDYAGFEIHPWFVQRGGYATNMYRGAYEACINDNAGTLELISKTGEQPMTGGEIDKLAYTSGSTEFTIGETLTGATSGATGIVVSYHLGSGTWAGGDAAGDVYVKQHDDTTPYQAEDINGSSGGANMATVGGAAVAESFTIANSETYANNKGTGWGSECIYAWHAQALLMYADLGTRNAQTALGRGIVDKASGTGFAGENTGADSADTNIGTNGTGTGTGTDGLTPIVWRGVENPYGNVWEFITGFLAVDAEYQIVNRVGLTSAVMPAGSFSDPSEYEVSTSVPITADGYIRDYARDALITGLFIPDTVTGSSSTYACDYLYAHDPGETNILLGGGTWTYGDLAGPGFLLAYSVPSNSTRNLGARLEFKPQRS